MGFSGIITAITVNGLYALRYILEADPVSKSLVVWNCILTVQLAWVRFTHGVPDYKVHIHINSPLESRRNNWSRRQNKDSIEGILRVSIAVIDTI